MHIEIIRKGEQAQGEFNFGAILENKPIGFPGEGGRGRPFSCLFYWAHAWTPGDDSTIGLHPHKAFEIISIILRGEIEHYDTQLRAWRHLRAGDAQVIRAGSGISHSEKILANSAIFQIWLDPNVQMTIGKPASYNDHVTDEFPLVAEGGVIVKRYYGEGAPMHLDAPITAMEEWRMGAGNHGLACALDEAVVAYVLEGSLEVDGHAVHQHDYFQVTGAGEAELKVSDDAKLFLIRMPRNPGYATYAGR